MIIIVDSLATYLNNLVSILLNSINILFLRYLTLKESINNINSYIIRNKIVINKAYLKELSIKILINILIKYKASLDSIKRDYNFLSLYLLFKKRLSRIS